MSETIHQRPTTISQYVYICTHTYMILHLYMHIHNWQQYYPKLIFLDIYVYIKRNEVGQLWEKSCCWQYQKNITYLVAIRFDCTRQSSSASISKVMKNSELHWTNISFLSCIFIFLYFIGGNLNVFVFVFDNNTYVCLQSYIHTCIYIHICLMTSQKI